MPEDLGAGFAMGCVGGAVWHMIKGARHSPAGVASRWQGGVAAVRVRAPILGGNFAVWGGLFSGFDCALKGARRKDDAWNAIASGALTGGVLNMRGTPFSISLTLSPSVSLSLSFSLSISLSTPSPVKRATHPLSLLSLDATHPGVAGGLRPSLQAAAFGGVFLALIQGVGVLLQRKQFEQHRPVQPLLAPDVAADPGGTSEPTPFPYDERPPHPLASQPAASRLTAIFRGRQQQPAVLARRTPVEDGPSGQR